MAIQFGVKEILTEVGKYGFGIVTGTGITLLGLLAWTGADDLQAIKDEFYDFEYKAQNQIDSAVLEYSEVVVDANAEIGEYKVALEQANDNISQLITAYESKQEELATKETELGNKQAELEELQEQLKENYVSVDEVNEVIAKANEQIGQANQEVADTKSDIETFVEQSIVNDGAYLQNKLDNVEHQLDTTGDKTVQDISSIVPSEQE